MIKFLLTHTRIHPLFCLILVAGAATGYMWETFSAFFIVLIHEWGHAAAAYAFGWKVVRIELLPFGGVARLDDDEDHPFWQEAAVIIAGPLQHLPLALLALALSHASFWGVSQQHAFLQENAALLLFNLLPIWPLDGGRLLHVALQMRYPFKAAYHKALIFSFFALGTVSFCLLFLEPYSFNLWIVLVFIALSIYKERRAVAFHFLRFLLATARRPARQPITRRLNVQSDAPLPYLFAAYYRQSEHQVHVEGTPIVLDGKRLLSDFFSGRCAGQTIADCNAPRR
ncbi:MAG: site-2 protease family protein [Sporolactobacillus sp.]